MFSSDSLLWFFFQLPTDGHDRAMYLIDIANKYGTEDGYMFLWGMFRKPIIIPCSVEVIGVICKSNGKRYMRRTVYQFDFYY